MSVTFASLKQVRKLFVAVCVLILCGFVVSVFSGSVLRYWFDAGSVKLEDFIGYSFAALVLLSVLIAFMANAHVRVNIDFTFKRLFHSRVARILAAFPFAAIAYLASRSVGFSWTILEGSNELNGLGGYFLVKTLLPITFVLIAVLLCIGRNDKAK